MQVPEPVESRCNENGLLMFVGFDGASIYRNGEQDL